MMQSTRRERILTYGGPGSSKTRSWMTIAEYYRKTNTPGKFYLLDTDDTYYANIEEFPELAETNIIEPHYIYEWTDYMAKAKEFAAKAKPGDWIIVDLFDKGWEEAQNEYSNRVYGEDKADYYLLRREEVAKAKKDPKNFQAFDGWTDWNVIKPMHASWANYVLFRNKAHVYLATTQKALDRKTDQKDIVDTFAHLGTKPGGEKSIGVHGVNTVIKFTNKSSGEWIMDTAKDRGERELMMSTRNNNFALDYLLHPSRGKWKMA
jgi:hypothetical protein